MLKRHYTLEVYMKMHYSFDSHTISVFVVVIDEAIMIGASNQTVIGDSFASLENF